MNKFLKVLAISGTAMMAMSGMVFAAPLNNDGLTVVLQKIKAGNITIKAPQDVILPEVNVSSQVEATSVVASDFRVDDARGSKVPAGWTATVTMGMLKSVADPTVKIPFIDPITSNNDYTLTMQTLAAYNGASLTGVSLGVAGAAQELLENGTTGTSQPVTVMSATAGNGKGQFSNDVKIDLKVPANSTAAEDYTSTMTFTVS